MRLLTELLANLAISSFRRASGPLGGVAEAPVRPAIDLVAQFIPDQAQHRADSLETLTGFVNMVVAVAVAAERLQGAVELPAHEALHSLAHRLALL